ncbi:hypothetical protein [Verminephrobacter aporrectodeae]|nr:hypothetical protein [Verminephrobacter aporrectodeae]
MLVNMDETRLTTIAQIGQFLVAGAVVQFTPIQDDEERREPSAQRPTA